MREDFVITFIAYYDYLHNFQCSDVRHFQREIEKLKMDISMWESTNKASTARLKQETDAKSTAEAKSIELSAELESLKSAERAQLKSDVDSERLQSLEQQTVEQQAALILYKHEATAKDTRIAEAERKLTQLAMELKETQERHSNVTAESASVAEENRRMREEIADLQTTLDKEVMKVAELQAKASDLEVIRAQLRIERDANATLTTQLTDTKVDLEEGNLSIEQLRGREEELLAINQELTECTAQLQNELSQHKARAMALTVATENVQREKLSFDTRYSDLEGELREERRSRREEVGRLEGELMESRGTAEGLEERLSTALGDIEAMRNKHQQAMKELNRELMLSQRRCGKLEEEGGRRGGGGTESEASHSGNVSDSESLKNGGEGNGGSNGGGGVLPSVAVMEPSKQSLIDRIVRLQQANAKQTEKLDFLEGHSAQLVAELQKKARLVHYYMMRDQSGALVSSKSDKHKAELAKYGGIMAAIYGGVKGSAQTADMTLDLSLEINRKLQAVLEDTLLKNITLKVGGWRRRGGRGI